MMCTQSTVANTAEAYKPGCCCTKKLVEEFHNYSSGVGYQSIVALCPAVTHTRVQDKSQYPEMKTD